MSVRVSTAVWRYSAHKGLAKLLLLAVADHAHNDGTGAFPSQESLSDKTGISERQVRRLLRQLVASGELQRKTRGRGYEYAVTVGPRRTPDKVTALIPDTVTAMTPDKAASTADIWVAEGGQRVRTNRKEPSGEREHLGDRGSRGTRRDSIEEQLADLERRMAVPENA